SIGGRQFSMTVTAGISLMPVHGTEEDTLIQNARIARNRAVNHGVPAMVFAEEMAKVERANAALEADLKLAIEHDLLVITDEIYSELLYDDDDVSVIPPHTSIASLPGMRERTILLHGFSKAFAMTGFRLGYSCAPPYLTEAMMKIHQYSMLCAPIMSQTAAVEALRNGAPRVEEMRREYAMRRNLMLRGFQRTGIPCFAPGGAFYLFPDISQYGLSSKEFALRLLEAESVAVVPGTAFGENAEGCVRACYATARGKLEEALVRLERFIQTL
ncbi:MAG: aminotransferase class I/II-fold pyridoxal phosphate-dependent enzyme, partial [Verrucomicrobiota bacterium]